MVTLACEGLSVRLGGTHVLHSISLEITPGQLVGVIGPNGAGKSTLLRALLGLVAADEGRVTIDGGALATSDRRTVARRIAYLPQGTTIHWPIAVERLVSLGRLPHLGPLSRMAAADTQAVERAMRRADIVQFRDRVATELSGGERARVMLARALAVEAEALVVDEPLASLDPAHQIDVMDVLRREVEAGTLVIVVLHDLTMAARHCDRLVMLDEGRVVADGDPTTVLTAERLSVVYGVSARIEQGEGGLLVVPTDRTRRVDGQASQA